MNVRMKRRLLLCTVALLLSFSLVGFDYGDIPQNRMPANNWMNVTWSDPGGWTTIDVTAHGLTPNNASIDAGAKLKEIIDAATSPTILYMPAGDYYINTDLTITKSNIRIKGAGMENTRIYLNGTAAPNRVRFGTGATGSPISVTGSPSAGSTTVTVSDASSLNTGDLVVIKQEYSEGDLTPPEGYGQTLLITGKSGNTLTFNMKLGLSYSSSKNPTLSKVTTIRNVGIEDVYIERTKNLAEGGLTFSGVYNGFARSVRSYKAGTFHIGISRSQHVIVENSILSHAWSYGSGGRGYGIAFLSYATRSRATNNHTFELRHHILLSDGANNNVISYNYAGPGYMHPSSGLDLNLHGNWAYQNLFEGNVGKDLNSDAFHGQDGPQNTFFRNRITTIKIQDGPKGPTNMSNIIGNTVLSSISIHSSSTNNYLGANQVNGTVQWGSLNSSSNLPASLYLTSRPAFLANYNWPVFGPNTHQWGAISGIPAETLGWSSLANGATKTLDSGWTNVGKLWDGGGSSGEAHTGNTSEGWVEFDLAGDRNIRKLRFLEDNNGTYEATEWKVQRWSTSLNAWVDIMPYMASTTSGWQEYTTPASMKSTKIRLYVKNSNGGGIAAASEFECIGY